METKKKFAVRALMIMTILFMIGIVLIFSSGTIGKNAGTTVISHDEYSSTSTYDSEIANTTTSSFQIVGAILSIVGGIGVLMSGYALYKEL